MDMVKKIQQTFFHAPSQQGQVLLIVVLVMVVALTVGLSVATRTITNVRTTTEEENSQRAFSAAEAGIERALKSLTTNQGLQNNANIKDVLITPITASTGNGIILNDGKAVYKNSGIDVWLANHDSNGNIDLTDLWNPVGNGARLSIHWGRGDKCSEAALEVIFLSVNTSGQLVTTHQNIDNCDIPTTRINSNRFGSGQIDSPGSVTQVRNTPNSVNGSPNYTQQVTFRGFNRLIHARVIPLYHDAPMAVSVIAESLPSQGQKIESTGESGETFRKIEVVRPYPGIPAELFSVLFSPAGGN